MGQTEVTQQAYYHVMNENPSSLAGLSLPVETVTWEEASEYCRRIGGRLPTEAEWEYAARAGSNQSRDGELDNIAWAPFNSGQRTHPVATKKANAFGLYDMLGNVFEWVADWHDPNYYHGQQSSLDPTGPTMSPDGLRVIRGGAWKATDGSRALRVSYRSSGSKGGGDNVGFRCVLPMK